MSSKGFWLNQIIGHKLRAKLNIDGKVQMVCHPALFNPDLVLVWILHV